VRSRKVPKFQIIAGKAAKLRQERRETKNTGTAVDISSGRDAAEPATRSQSTQDSSENPILPDDTIGSLSDFGVSTSGQGQQPPVVNVVEAASQGPTALRYGIWIAALLGAISVFYGVVFAASGGISNVLKNYWPKKDFIPYSERRRLEDDLAATEESRGSAPGLSGGASNPGSLAAPSDLLNLMPGKGK
jgi:hypothetical protein